MRQVCVLTLQPAVCIDAAACGRVWALQRCNNRLDDAIDMLEKIPVLVGASQITNYIIQNILSHLPTIFRP